MDAQSEEHHKSTILRDAGCGCVWAMLLGGVVSGMVAHYFPNYLRPPLYDAGGWFLSAMFLGAVFAGVMVDYFWNFLILYLALRWQKISTTIKRRFAYAAIITAAGLLIDWLYYELAWGFLIFGNLRVPPIFEGWGTKPGLELSTILIPMALIGVVNYLTSRFYLHLGKKHASLVGLAMGVFTAPWLIVAFVLLGW